MASSESSAVWCKCYKTFFCHHQWWCPISWRGCPWKSYPSGRRIWRQGQRKPILEDLSDASFFEKLLVLPTNVRPDWKVIARYKHFSLLGLIISDKERRFYNIDTWSSIKTLGCTTFPDSFEVFRPITNKNWLAMKQIVFLIESSHKYYETGTYWNYKSFKK